MASTGGRRRPQKYPDELRERAVKMVLDVRQQTGEKHGAVTRVAKELGARLRWAAMGVEPICHVLEIAPTTYWSTKTRPGVCTREARRGSRPRAGGVVGEELPGLRAPQADPRGPQGRDRHRP
jgi:hypothetical protein